MVMNQIKIVVPIWWCTYTSVDKQLFLHVSKEMMQYTCGALRYTIQIPWLSLLALTLIGTEWNYLPSFLTTHLPTYSAIYLCYLGSTHVSCYIYLPTYLPAYLPTYLTTYLPTYLPTFSVALPTCLPSFFLLQLYLATCLPLKLPICLQCIHLPLSTHLTTYLRTLFAYIGVLLSYLPTSQGKHFTQKMSNCHFIVRSSSTNRNRCLEVVWWSLH